MNVNMNVNYLAHFLFKENNGTKVTLSSTEFENSKDLFFFCLDLFFKGIILLYSKDSSNSVTINDLTEEQLNNISELMKCAHINPNLCVNHKSTYSDENIIKKYITGNVYNEIELMDKNLKLNQYIFKLAIGELVYELNFSLTQMS